MRVVAFALIIWLAPTNALPQTPQGSANGIVTLLKLVASATGLESEAAWYEYLKREGLTEAGDSWRASRPDGDVEVISSFNIATASTTITFTPSSVSRIADPLLEWLVARTRTVTVSGDRFTLTLPTDSSSGNDVTAHLLITLDGHLLRTVAGIVHKRR